MAAGHAQGAGRSAGNVCSVARRTRFAVDTWATLKGISADEQLLVETTETVDASVEVPEARWAPIPSTGPIFDELAFIDGVRRQEANVWVTAEDGTERAGVCASVAAGAAVISGRSNSVQSVRVHRGLYTAPGPETGIDTDAGEYELVECTDPGEGFTKHINDKMADIEHLVTVPASVDLIVYDGPLRGRTDPKGVGYAKTMARRYLPENLHTMLRHLDAGDRTPVFRIGEPHNAYCRWAWYLRLPGERPHRLACLVRCEMPARTISASGAAHRASRVTTTLMRYASEPYVEERAPQNLYPIAALERELRNYLGDEHLLKMSLLAAARAEPAAHAAETGPVQADQR